MPWSRSEAKRHGLLLEAHGTGAGGNQALVSGRRGSWTLSDEQHGVVGLTPPVAQRPTASRPRLPEVGPPPDACGDGPRSHQPMLARTSDPRAAARPARRCGQRPSVGRPPSAARTRGPGLGACPGADRADQPGQRRSDPRARQADDRGLVVAHVGFPSARTLTRRVGTLRDEVNVELDRHVPNQACGSARPAAAAIRPPLATAQVQAIHVVSHTSSSSRHPARRHPIAGSQRAITANLARCRCRPGGERRRPGARVP